MAESTSSIWSRLTSKLLSYDSPSSRLFLTAFCSSGLTLFTVLLGQEARRRSIRRQLRLEVEEHWKSRRRRRRARRLSGVGEGEGRRGSSGDDDSEGEELGDWKEAEGENGELELDEHGLPKHLPRRARGQPDSLHSHRHSSRPDESLISEQLTRNIAFLGEEGNRKVREAFVIVVGLGGVGSSAATMLARSGVGKIRLIDFDQVTLSSLNRHATATRSDVGTPKVLSCSQFFSEIAPWITLEPYVEQFTLSEAPRLLAGRPDWVLDCIDNITTKVDLLAYCKRNGIRVVSALGAASKADPSRIQLADISETLEDPLARAVRRRLRLEGVHSGVPVVYSTEVPSENVKLLPLPEEEFQKGQVGELAALAAFRVRILPVLGPIPAMFGQALAAHVLTELAGFPTRPLRIKGRAKLYQKLFNECAAREMRLTGVPTIPLNEDDVAYLFEDLHRGRSIISPTHTSGGQHSLLRWSASFPLSWENAVVMTREEAKRHEEECLVQGREGREVWGEETEELVQARVREERVVRKWRM